MASEQAQKNKPKKGTRSSVGNKYQNIAYSKCGTITGKKGEGTQGNWHTVWKRNWITTCDIQRRRVRIS